MKKVLTLIIVILSIFLIYLGFKDKDIYFLSLGDSIALGINQYGKKDYGYADYVKDYLNEKNILEVYVSELTDSNKRTTDIIKEITNNIEVNVNGKNKTFQNVLIKSDLITISIGINDLMENTKLDNDFNITDLYNKLEQTTKDFEQLFELLREYCKEQIIFIGLYNPTNDENLDEFFEYANKKIGKLASTYNIDYILINEEFENEKYLLKTNPIYPNKEGHEIIAKKIIEIINEKVIKK